jgi:Tfp pilus assembly protein PilZ
MANYIIKNKQLRDLEGRKDVRKKFNDFLTLAECITKNSVFKAPIYDISSSGVFIATSKHFSIGQEIAMTITFPATGESLMVTGEIVRVSSQGVGVNFKVFFKD